jgi:hypothetical protein
MIRDHIATLTSAAFLFAILSPVALAQTAPAQLSIQLDKGSTGYPDKILNTSYFRHPQYFATDWKVMPSDLSSPRLNIGLHKVMLGEVDVFQLAQTDELYGHLNVNYVRLDKLPDFDHCKILLDAAARGDSFISTGEVLMPSSKIESAAGDSIHVEVQTSSTFPLRVAEVVWGDGKSTHREYFDLDMTHEFEQRHFQWNVDALAWKWARVAVWDVAGGGAFSNPTWRINQEEHQMIPPLRLLTTKASRVTGWRAEP